MSLVIKLLPNQVPQFWEAIKHSTLNAERLRGDDAPLYFNRLLHQLLSSKAQCFVKVSNDKKELEAILITRIIADEVTGNKTLFINALYSYKKTLLDEWVEGMKTVIEFAKVNNCKIVSTISSNKRIYEIVEAIGFKERYRNFTLEV